MRRSRKALSSAAALGTGWDSVLLLLYIASQQPQWGAVNKGLCSLCHWITASCHKENGGQVEIVLLSTLSC